MTRALGVRRAVAVGAVALGPGVGACNLLVDTSDYDFSGGGGAPTPTSSTASASTTTSGDGGQGGQTCVPDCKDRECGPDGCGSICGTCATGTCSDAGMCCPDTWAVRLTTEARHLVTSPNGLHVHVGDEGGTVRALSTCNGTPTPASPDGFATMSARIRGLRWVGSEVVAVGTGNGAIRIHRLDPATLAPLGASPEEINGTNGQDSFQSELGPDGALWVSVHEDGGKLVRVKPTEKTCVLDLDSSPLFAMGLTTTPKSLVLTLLHPLHGVTAVRRYPWSGFDALACKFTGGGEDEAALQSVVNGMAAHGERVYVAQLAGTPGSNIQALLSRHDPGGDDVTTTLDVAPNLDGFMSVAATSQEVLVAGVAGGQYGNSGYDIVSGDAWIWRYGASFAGAASPNASARIEGGRIAWNVERGSSGIYVAGKAQDGGGFVAKCTLDLNCPSLPAPPN